MPKALNILLVSAGDKGIHNEFREQLDNGEYGQSPFAFECLSLH
jgi:hypothetical protein